MDYNKLINNLFITGKRINKKLLQRITLDKYPNIYNYIMNIFEDSDSIYETIKRLQLHIDKKPLCLCCNKPVKFVGLKNRIFLQSCGDIKCSKYINQLHLQETCINKYGVSNPAKSIEIKKKQQHTCIEKYGYITPLLNTDIKEKTKHTNISRYGLEIPQQALSVKQKISLSNIKTCNYKYGVDNPMKLDYIKQQAYCTKKQNNSFNVSKPEDECYELLKEKYPDVVRQYKDNRYPFSCDFYIHSIDVFIEYNGLWTHGGKQYEGTINDLKKLQLWKDKNTKYYDNAIYTWTILDVKKRNIAKQNKLNYIEFWNILDVKQWLQMN